MKKMLIIVFIIGGLVMLKPINAFIKGAVDNIVHRRNLVTGIITADNSDKSYAVEIGESGKSIKRIFTLSPDPDLVVGDKARVLYRGGNKEDMILLAPTKLYVDIIAYIYYAGGKSYVAIFDLDGNFIKEVNYYGSSYATGNDGVAVDKNGNIHIAGRWSDKLLKLDSEGNTLKEITYTTATPNQVAIDPDGYVWVYEWDDDGDYYVRKREPTTLEIIDEVNMTSSALKDYNGMAFDSSGYLYMVDWHNGNIEKWDVDSRTRVTWRALAGGAEDHPISSSLAVIGSDLVLVQWAAFDKGDYWTCPTDLSANFIPHTLAEFGGSSWVESITAVNGSHFIVCGDTSGEQQAIVKYNTGFSLVWNKPYNGLGGGLSISAYPF